MATLADSNWSERFTRNCLRVFVASVVASAITGAAVLAIPSQDSWFELQVFLTTIIIAGASVCGLACGGCLTRGHTILPTAGIVLAFVSAVLLLVGTWGEVDSEGFWKTVVSVTAFAVACAHLSLLFMAELRGAYRWAHVFSYQVILGLAGLIALGVVFEFFDNEAYWRLTGVLSVAAAALTLVTPVFHFFSRQDAVYVEAETDSLLKVEQEIARLQKRLIELQEARDRLLGRGVVDLSSDS